MNLCEGVVGCTLDVGRNLGRDLRSRRRRHDGQRGHEVWDRPGTCAVRTRTVRAGTAHCVVWLSFRNYSSTLQTPASGIMTLAHSPASAEAVVLSDRPRSGVSSDNRSLGVQKCLFFHNSVLASCCTSHPHLEYERRQRGGESSRRARSRRQRTRPPPPPVFPYTLLRTSMTCASDTRLSVRSHLCMCSTMKFHPCAGSGQKHGAALASNSRTAW